MPSDSEQLPLIAPGADRMPVELQNEYVSRCKSRRDSIRKCFEASGLEQKQVYGPLGIPQANFTKILNGQSYLDPNKLGELMRICGNEIPVRYDVAQLDCEMKPRRSSLERELEETRTALEQERLVNRRLGEMLTGAKR